MINNKKTASLFARLRALPESRRAEIRCAFLPFWRNELETIELWQIASNALSNESELKELINTINQ